MHLFWKTPNRWVFQEQKDPVGDHVGVNQEALAPSTGQKVIDGSNGLKTPPTTLPKKWKG